MLKKNAELFQDNDRYEGTLHQVLYVYMILIKNVWKVIYSTVKRFICYLNQKI